MKTSLLAQILMFLVSCGPRSTGSHFFSDDVQKSQSSEFGWPSLTIYSTSGEDPNKALFKKQGYEQARLRMPQMDMLRRVATGRLSEIMASQKDADTEHVVIGLPIAVENSESLLKSEYPTEYGYVEALASGINAYISEKNLKYEPWQVRDTVAIQVLMGFAQSVSYKEKLNLGKIYRKHFVETGKSLEFSKFVVNQPLFDTSFVSQIALTSRAPRNHNRRYPHFEYACLDLPHYSLSCSGQSFQGSNAFAVSGSRSGSAAFLAADPHLPLMADSLFMEMALDSTPAGGSFKVRGMAIPGVPGILLGENTAITWGMTNSQADVDSIYFEDMVDEGHVQFGSQVVALEHRDFEIKVNGSSPIHIHLKIVPHHGPIISKLVSGLDADTALAYKWTGHSGSAEIAATLRLNQAQNFNEFKQALAHFKVGAGNFLYADREGNIGFYQHGSFPRRLGDLETYPPFIPQPGDGTYEWEGFWKNFVEVYNPEEGYIAVTNDRLFQNGPYFTYKASQGERAHRIQELLKATSQTTIQSLQAIQNDVFDHYADALLNMVDLASINLDIAKKLRLWNRRMDQSANEPLLYMAWLYAIAADEMNMLMTSGTFREFVETPHGLSTLFHRIQMKNTEERLAFFERTLKLTETTLKTRKWFNASYGSVHHYKFEPTSPVMAFYNFQAKPTSGSWHTVNVGGIREATKSNGAIPEDFAQNYGAVLRMIIKMDGSEAQAILPGASGMLNKKETVLWSEGKLRPMVSFNGENP